MHAAKVNGAVVNLRAKGDKLGVRIVEDVSKFEQFFQLNLSSFAGVDG